MHLRSLRRQRLLDQIDYPYLAPITLITAPAGYGKSTLAKQWAENQHRGVGLVMLFEDSNTPERILSQVYAAARNASPDIEVEAPDTGDLSMDDLVNLLKSISRAGREITIIIDDYHLINNKDVHDAINGQLGHLPKGIHAIILSRTIPPLSFGRLRAYGQLRHLTEADLRFTPEEVKNLVADIAADIPLSTRQTTDLTSRTDGWIAGIRLTLASLKIPENQRRSFDDVIESLSAQRWLDDYIVDEVLDTLPPDLRDFVIDTSILTSLDPDMCDTVLDITTSRQFLRDLSRRIVFVSHPGASESPLVYHQLFAECVERISYGERSPAEIRTRHLRAAHWYEHHDRLESALDHAINAEAWILAKQWATQVCQTLVNSDLMHSALFWLRKLPVSQRRDNTRLAYWYVKTLQHTGQLREAAKELEVLRPAWEQSTDPRLHGYLASADALFAIFEGDNDSALFHLYQMVHFLPMEEINERFYAWSVLHQFEFLRGHDEVAEHAFRQAAHCHTFLPQGPGWWLHQVEMDRANHRALRADLVTAEELYRLLVQKLPAGSKGFEAKIRFRLAAIYLEWNDLDRALEEANLTREGLDRYPLYAWHPEALLVIGQVYLACGDITQARACLKQVEVLYQEHGGESTMSRVRALTASYWLAEGKIGMAREWAERWPENDHLRVRIYGEGDTHIPLIQLLLAEGTPQKASEIARRCIAAANQINHLTSLVQFHTWEAVARNAMGDEAAAMESLRIAIHYGARGNFIRTLDPPGHNLRPLLRNLQPTLSSEEANYVQRVLAMRAGTSARVARANEGSGPNTINPLTGREQDVLLLLRDGLTNQDIATRLFITERTVKKHVGNILTKLDATNRTLAVYHARKLGILQS